MCLDDGHRGFAQKAAAIMVDFFRHLSLSNWIKLGFPFNPESGVATDSCSRSPRCRQPMTESFLARQQLSCSSYHGKLHSTRLLSPSDGGSAGDELLMKEHALPTREARGS
jgi:hypothetical protein